MSDRNSGGGETAKPIPASDGPFGAAGGNPSPSGFGADSAPGQAGDLGGAATDPLSTADEDTDPADLGGMGAQRGPGDSNRD